MDDLTHRVFEFLAAKRSRGENLDYGRLLTEIDRSFGQLINGAQWGHVQQFFLQGGPPSTHIVRREERRSEEGGASSTGQGGGFRERVFSHGGTSSVQGGEGGEEEEEDGDLEAATGETFCSYNPGLTAVGNAHPDLVDESATLASIKQPECQYKLGLPPEVVLRRLSNLQLETIQMTCERFGGFLPDGSRQGFYLGDGAGMGKGRQIGGLVYELLLRGHKKAVWFSASAGLHYDAERDIGDLGALKYIQLHRLDQYNYGELPMTSGVLFSTYSMLISTSGSDGTSRLDQITQWLGEDFEGLICFDEAHKAKHGEHMNAKGEMVTGTLTAAAVLELQRRLPKARIIYVSATAATEPST